jgi:hypothetical protein
MTDPRQTAEFLDARHPEYVARSAEWEFHLRSFLGGRAYLDGRNLYTHRLEHPSDAARRLSRSYYQNHCRNVVERTTALLFAGGFTVAPEPPPYLLTDADRRGADLAQVMRRAATLSSIHGHVFILVDVPRADGDGPRTRREELALGLRPYLELVSPTEVVNWDVDDGGRLVWALVRERAGHSDVIGGPSVRRVGEARTVYRLWTPTAWFLYEKPAERPAESWVLADSAEHGLGVVPLAVVRHRDLDGGIGGASLLRDIAVLNREVYNLASLLQEVLYRQTFGQLVAQGSAEEYVGEDETLAKLGTSSIFLYPVGREAPRYISPEPANAEMLQSQIDRLVAEIYRLAGLQVPEVDAPRAPESGLARAYRFLDTSGTIRDKAAAVGDAFEQALWLASLWEGREREYRINFREPMTNDK